MKKLLHILLLLPLLTFSQWNITGFPIYGENSGDLSGGAISLSSNGNVIAIGAYYNDGNGTDSGHVRVFENISGVWTQIGQDIDGETAGDSSGGVALTGIGGTAVSLNSNGSVIAIGASANDANGAESGHVRVYQNVSGTWVQVGPDIDGLTAGERFGASVNLNTDGTILAVGAPYQSAGGLVRIYELTSPGTWTQQGSDIIAEASGDLFGVSVSLNTNGNILAIGAQENDGTASGAGHVRVYSYTAGQNKNNSNKLLGSWAQLGSDIDGEGQNDRSGCSVSLDTTGNILAIGGKYNIAGGLGVFSGHVRVFERISNVWTQIGSDIDSAASEDQFGYSVSLSSDGTRVAAGALYNDNNGNNSGQIRVFDNISGTWTQVYSVINGTAAGDEFGSSISISGDGYTVAAGSIWNSTNSSASGEVRVYQDAAFLGISENELQNLSFYPNPTNNSFSIETTQIVENIIIYDIQGKEIKNFAANSQYNIKYLAVGVYLVKIQTDKGITTKKLIKQ